jgi:hypothetical protein
VHLYDDTTSYEARNVLLRNLGNGKFRNVSDECGDGLAVRLSSRGAVFDDFDNDGDIDAAIVNSRRESTILRNDSRGGHWIELRLVGTSANRDGVGAHVRVTTGTRTQLAEVHSGRGYQGHHGTRLHFGLGAQNHIDRIEVRWIGGTADVVRDLAADRILTIRQGGAATPVVP